MKLRNFFSHGRAYAVTLGVIFSVFFVTMTVSAVSTISTNISTGGTLTVSGASTLTGALTVSNGASTFNEIGGDNNFRIEGDTVTNLFIADASGDRIGIASTTPSATLGVVGDATFSSAATTTVRLHSSLADTGGCVEIEGTDGTLYHIMATSTANSAPVYWTSGACQ